jgi:hypothetical protein
MLRDLQKKYATSVKVIFAEYASNMKAMRILSPVISVRWDCLCGLVVRVPGYTSRGPSSISGATRFSEIQWV